MKVVEQLLSAGGVVVRRDRHGTRILVLRHRDSGEWRLPKGKLHPGESAAQAAEREVREETGLALEAGRYLGVTHYFYPNPTGSGCISKFVFFFEMEAGEGRVALEETFDDAEWLPPAAAMERLTWDNEAEMVKRATQWR
ncbi:MAG: NUDIX hydrolase [Armatimonadota bacterium]